MDPSDHERIRGPYFSRDSLGLQERRQSLIAKMFGSDERERIGHYEILGEIGRGGMGIVYLALDHKLERKVAIKRLQDRANPEARCHLVHEAKAMAKLSHPNVVPVYEIREHDDLICIVMEFIEGVTLKEWLGQKPRETEEILSVFMAAGLGVCAAHSCGLVHRDFKPTNVMIGLDGRVRVMDFGLACPDPGSDVTVAMNPAASSGKVAIAGTPAYMAPEQFRKRWADARSDQFSFCVTLYEALYGKRPFSGSTPEQTWRAAEQGKIRPAPRSTTVPKWLYEAIVRGLQSDPKRRFESMEMLLDALVAKEQALMEIQTPQERAANSHSRRPTYAAVLSLLVACAVTTLSIQPRICPAVVDIQACCIRIEGNDQATRAWVILEHGGEYEIEVDGKVLHFDCVGNRELASVVVDLEAGGLVYWSNVELSGDDILRLSDATPGVPDGLSLALQHELETLVATRMAQAASPSKPDPAVDEPLQRDLAIEELGGQVPTPSETAPPTSQRDMRNRGRPSTLPKPEPPSPDADRGEDAELSAHNGPTLGESARPPNVEEPMEEPKPKPLTQQYIHDALDEYSVGCGNKYNRSLLTKIKVEISVEANGQVADVDVLSASKVNEVAACVVAVIKKTSFPRQESDSVHTVSLPLRETESVSP